MLFMLYYIVTSINFQALAWTGQKPIKPAVPLSSPSTVTVFCTVTASDRQKMLNKGRPFHWKFISVA